MLKIEALSKLKLLVFSKNIIWPFYLGDLKPSLLGMAVILLLRVIEEAGLLVETYFFCFFATNLAKA